MASSTERVSVTRKLIRSISHNQRDSLLAHVNGPQPIVVGADSRFDKTHMSFATLVRQGLLRGEPPEDPRPRSSVLTELGRAVVAHILAEYADALVAAGMMHDGRTIRPIDALQIIKHRWRVLSDGGENSPQLTGHPPGTTV